MMGVFQCSLFLQDVKVVPSTLLTPVSVFADNFNLLTQQPANADLFLSLRQVIVRNKA